MLSCDIVDLPFFDKEKAIVKGIDRKIPKKSLDDFVEAFVLILIRLLN